MSASSASAPMLQAAAAVAAAMGAGYPNALCSMQLVRLAQQAAMPASAAPLQPSPLRAWKAAVRGTDGPIPPATGGTMESSGGTPAAATQLPACSSGVTGGQQLPVAVARRWFSVGNPAARTALAACHHQQCVTSGTHPAISVARCAHTQLRALAQLSTPARGFSSSSSQPGDDSKPAGAAAASAAVSLPPYDPVYNMANAVSVARLVSGPFIAWWLLAGQTELAVAALLISGVSTRWQLGAAFVSLRLRVLDRQHCTGASVWAR